MPQGVRRGDGSARRRRSADRGVRDRFAGRRSGGDRAALHPDSERERRHERHDRLAEHRRISETDLRLLQKLKTGCLLRAACELGCAAAGKTDTESIAAARAYGDKLGLAFQIEDDILDIEGDEKTLGKSIGKDAASEKSTFPSLLGLDACRKLAGELTEQAVAALTPYEGRAFLETLARSLTGRKS